MLNYSDSGVVQCLRQYDMFANSLKLVKSKDERDMIVKQLTKLENKIIELTNENYEEEYYTLVNKECGLLDEEKKRLSMLIDLINQRLSYIDKRCNDHYQLTGETIDISDVLGATTLDTLENRVRVIDKYEKNIKLEKELKEDVKSLSSKIALAHEKIDINKSLNIELESKLKNLLSSTFEKLELYDLLDAKDEIEYAYYETEKSLTLAELNLETAKTSPVNILSDCQMMLKDIREDYVKYKEKISILKLMEIFNKDVNNYDELLNKRRQINEILKHIKNEEFISMVMDTVNKQYNTIMMEQQDINTFNDLNLEKERKLEALAEIEEENNSEEFQTILKVLIENERKKQEKILEEKRRLEEEERKKKLEIERKKQEEILKRQKIIEEARKKEIEKRTKKLLEQQQNSVLQTKKKENTVSFETIKDISNSNKDIEKDNTVEINSDENSNSKLDDFKDLQLETNKVDEEFQLDNSFFKNKVDIEKELFEEFNDSKKEEKVSTDTVKLPSIDIDEYMKNFDEKNIDDTDNLFEDDNIFPSIPM